MNWWCWTPVMKGYYNNPAETRNTIDADGWLHTGDIARMNADGYFYIVNRKKDLIIASGYNIAPHKAEEVLFMHPNVVEAAVVGVPDAKRGEIKAFVVREGGQSPKLAHTRRRVISSLSPATTLTRRDDQGRAALLEQQQLDCTDAPSRTFTQGFDLLAGAATRSP